MFYGKSFNEKFLLMKKYHDFARAINCTCKLTCMCACTCACDHTRLREQYVSIVSKLVNNRILDHLRKCGLFCDLQYGFRSSQSTSDLLTVVSQGCK